MRNALSLSLLIAVGAVTSCGVDDSGGDGRQDGDGTSGGNGSGGTLINIETGGTGDVSGLAGNGSGEACASAHATTALAPVRLAVLFDASGSMGELDYPWHDPEVKWEPIVAATEAFFTDPASTGIAAFMTLFPSLEDRCNPDQYLEPDVPLTDLPSTAFGDLLDTIVPDRGGTPTWAVLSATATVIETMAEDEPDATYAIVLVSDGYPQGCSDDDDLDYVAQAARDVADTIPTYVIGVRNPPIDGAPENVENLHQIAQAGGTESAFLIDTGNPEQTTSDFVAAIDGIRGRTLSCALDIPPPPEGRELDPQRVSVVYTSTDVSTTLSYDSGCSGSNGWRYDDPDDPIQILLCEDTCNTVLADPNAELDVEFACEVLIPTLY